VQRLCPKNAWKCQMFETHQCATFALRYDIVIFSDESAGSSLALYTFFILKRFKPRFSARNRKHTAKVWRNRIYWPQSKYSVTLPTFCNPCSQIVQLAFTISLPALMISFLLTMAVQTRLTNLMATLSPIGLRHFIVPVLANESKRGNRNIMFTVFPSRAFLKSTSG